MCNFSDESFNILMNGCYFEKCLSPHCANYISVSEKN